MGAVNSKYALAACHPAQKEAVNWKILLLC